MESHEHPFLGEKRQIDPWREGYKNVRDWGSEDPIFLRKNRTYSGNKYHEDIVAKIKNVEPVGGKRKPVLTIMGTGTRDIDKYVLEDQEEIYQSLLKRLLQIQESHAKRTGGGTLHLVSGMQLGFDELIARAAIELDIPFTAVVPTKSFGKHYWHHNLLKESGSSRLKDFNDYLKKAAHVIYGEDVYGKSIFVKKESIPPPSMRAWDEPQIPGPNFLRRDDIGREFYSHSNMARNDIMVEMSDYALAFPKKENFPTDTIYETKWNEKIKQFDIYQVSGQAPGGGTGHALVKLNEVGVPTEIHEPFSPRTKIQNTQGPYQIGNLDEALAYVEQAKVNSVATEAAEVATDVEANIISQTSENISEAATAQLEASEQLMLPGFEQLDDGSIIFKSGEEVTEAALAEEAERLKVLQTLAPELQMSAEELEAAGLTRLDNGMIEFTEGITESVAPIEAVTEGMPTGIVDEATEAIEDLARPIVSTIDEGIGDIGSAIIHSNKLKFGALGVAAIGGIGLVNKLVSKRNLDEAERNKQLNQLRRSSSRTFSNTMNAGYQSIDVLKNRKRS